MQPTRDCDIVILGGGVAGVVAGIQLARAGRQPVLITSLRDALLFEGMSPRTADGLRFAGCDHALAAAGPWVDRYSNWNGERNQANGETLVDRKSFDLGLIEDAREAGVDVRIGRIESVTEAVGGWRIGAPDVGEETIHAEFLIEARGRQAPAHGNRRHGPASTALVRRWQLRDGHEPVSAVASFANGWCWFARPRGVESDLQIVVASKDVPARPELEPYYMDRVSEIPEASDWLRGAVPEGPVMARNANVYISDDLVGSRSIRIGDAAHGFDPLSGHGQFQAVSTALNAVAVVATLLDQPANAELAQRFYAERVEQAFLTQARVGRDFYRLDRRWANRPFWSERAKWPDDRPAHPRPSAAPPEIASRPVIEDGYVVERDVVVTADHPRGVWRIDGVSLVALMRFLDREWRPGADLSAEAARHLSCRPDQVEKALGWLGHRGLLIARE